MTVMFRVLWQVAAVLAWLPAFAAGGPLLLQHPSVSQTLIAFDYAGEIWTVPRSGGQATPVVMGQGQNRRPIFSPDGRYIAFTGRYDGNTDVFVVPAGGGEPRRLTWHPGDDEAVAWTADGKSVVFRSPRTSPRDLVQLYTVPAEGGAPMRIPLPSGYEASFSPDGTHLAYSPFGQRQPAWKRYRGGQTARIWIAALADSSVVPVPRENSNDRNPMWVGDTVYFLSDRDGPTTLYAYDTLKGNLRQVIANARGFDIVSASTGPGAIVYDQFGALRLYDLHSGTVNTVQVTIAAELPQTRPHFVSVAADDIQHAALTPTGKRVLFEIYGEILSAPVEHGDVRNLTRSPGVADRDPAASPDGHSVAYFSDESGEYALHIRPAEGTGPVRKISLGAAPSFFYEPRWSPDSHKISYYDKRLTLWVLDLDKAGGPVRMDQDLYESPVFHPQQAWSPDSRWIAYTKQLPNHLHAAFVYSLETGRVSQLTDGSSDVQYPRFDRGGDYLYFTADATAGLRAGWSDMSSLGRASESSVYAVLLRNDVVSPVGLRSDEEASAARKTDSADAVPRVRIDFQDLDRRVVALPIAAANIVGLETGAPGVVFTLTAPTVLTAQQLAQDDDDPAETAFRFDLRTRRNLPLATNIAAGTFSCSADGSRVLYLQEGAWKVAASDPGEKEPAHAINLANALIRREPRAEWRQIYREAWRIERDFLYDPKLQGLDYPLAQRVYAPFVEGIASRQDLSALLAEMTGQIAVSHTFVRGGTLSSQALVKVGLLGADYTVAGNRYRISRILRGDHWTQGLVAPLAQPGLGVQEGDFLLAVNGREVTTDAEVYRAFEGLADQQISITVGPRADGTGSRQVTVVPIASETSLRLHTWVEDNRHRVDELSGGRLAYVYLPDEVGPGLASFDHYYFGQVDKRGAVIDERFNHGGRMADYVIDVLKRTPQAAGAAREGADTMVPAEAIFGPKVMIINEFAGSGGDALPWMFQHNHIGPLVGTRTWGGLVGAGGYPPLLDGGEITAPRWAIFGLQGQWEVENNGVAPDVEVEQDPALVRQGHDPQLERAVEVALQALRGTPPLKFERPVYPDRKPVLPAP
jgi:tricorn protease